MLALVIIIILQILPNIEIHILYYLVIYLVINEYNINECKI